MHHAIEPAPSAPRPPSSPEHAFSVPHVITHGPSFALLRVQVSPGSTVVAEAGAMVARDGNVVQETKLNAPRNAGFFGMVRALFVAIVRKFVGGETFFVNHFTAPSPGSLWLAPTWSGPIVHRRMNGERLTLSTGAYVAHVGDVDMRLKFGGLRALLSKEGLFFLEITGHGDLFFSSYGGVQAIDVRGSYVVDNGHIVGFEGNLELDVRSAGGGLLGFAASGEGIVTEFRGEGRIYIQSRSVGSLVDWLVPILPG